MQHSQDERESQQSSACPAPCGSDSHVWQMYTVFSCYFVAQDVQVGISVFVWREVSNFRALKFCLVILRTISKLFEETVLSKLYEVRLLSFVSTNALFDAALCFLPSFGHVCAALCFFTGMLFLGVMFVRYNLEIV